jgi:hypothetical protein
MAPAGGALKAEIVVATHTLLTKLERTMAFLLDCTGLQGLPLSRATMKWPLVDIGDYTYPRPCARLTGRARGSFRRAARESYSAVILRLAKG